MSDAAANALDPVRILLVDDNPSRLLSYRAILDPLGETLVEASSGMEALRRVMSEDFAVILLDVNMPEMDGFETASLIHQQDADRVERAGVRVGHQRCSHWRSRDSNWSVCTGLAM